MSRAGEPPFLEVVVTGVDDDISLRCCGVYARVSRMYAQQMMSASQFRLVFGTCKRRIADAVYLMVGDDRDSVATANGRSTLALIYDPAENQIFCGGVHDTVEDYFYANLSKVCMMPVDVGGLAVTQHWCRVHPSTHEVVGPVTLGPRVRMLARPPNRQPVDVDLQRLLRVHELASAQDDSSDGASDAGVEAGVEAASEHSEDDGEDSEDDDEDSDDDRPLASRMRTAGAVQPPPPSAPVASQRRVARAVPAPPPSAPPPPTAAAAGAASPAGMPPAAQAGAAVSAPDGAAPVASRRRVVQAPPPPPARAWRPPRVVTQPVVSQPAAMAAAVAAEPPPAMSGARRTRAAHGAEPDSPLAKLPRVVESPVVNNNERAAFMEPMDLRARR